MNELISVLSAVAMAPPGEEQPGGILGSPLFLFVIIIVMFYFILYLPEKKRRQQRENMIKSLERGDEVVTSGGLYGKITALTDKIATIEIAPNVRVRVVRSQLSKVGGGGGEESSGKTSGKSKDSKEKNNKKDKK